MKTRVRFWMVAVALPGLLTGMNAAADTANDTGFMQCFYECKLYPPAAPSFYQEQTTLMLMNGDQPLEPTLQQAHPVTRIANLAFLNGNERILGKARIALSPRDLDELNVCFTIFDNTGNEPPPAGIVLIAITQPNGEPGRDVDVAVKNPVGRMSLDDPEVFNGRISGVGKTPCFEVNQNIFSLLDSEEYQVAPDWDTLLIEGTKDPEPAGGA